MCISQEKWCHFQRFFQPRQLRYFKSVLIGMRNFVESMIDKFLWAQYSAATPSFLKRILLFLPSPKISSFFFVFWWNLSKSPFFLLFFLIMKLVFRHFFPPFCQKFGSWEEVLFALFDIFLMYKCQFCVPHIALLRSYT